MLKSKPKILVIMGPTASGKSDVAIKLAQKFHGEIISADSRQVYRGMDVGSGKVPRDIIVESEKSKVKSSNEKEFYSEGIKHHLLDVADPNQDFNISHFKTLTEKAIEEILAKGKLPIICGGTGFWIQAVVNNVILPKVAPNEKLRQELSLLSAEELFAMLQKADSLRAQAIDQKNKFRLIRALEICQALGKVPAATSISKMPSAKYEFLQIGINMPKEKLHSKIKKRLEIRFDQAMIKEVQNLHKHGISWQKLESFGLEYRRIAEFLQQKISEKEMKELLYFDIIHYAKRQMTWFKRNKEIIWLKNYNEIENQVIKFLEMD